MQDITQLFKYGTCNLKNILNPSTNYYGYDNNNANLQQYRTAVIVIGCGGTGGRTIPLLAQHIANHNSRVSQGLVNNLYLPHKIRFILYDNDVVEAKNLLRQNFYAFDIGRGKAEVMAERYSALFNMDIEYKNQKFNASDVTNREDFYYIKNLIVFDHTDNKAARESIEKIFHTPTNTSKVLISTGNEEDFGQVMISQDTGQINSTRAQNLLRTYKSLKDFILKEDPKGVLAVRNMPTLLELFRDFQDTVKPSCTDVTLINDQSMPINSLVAQLAYNAFYHIVSGKDLNYNIVKCNISNTFSTNYITYPPDVLSLIIRGIYGDLEEDYSNVLDEAMKISNNIYSYDRIIKFFVENDKKLTSPFYESFVEKNYYKTNIKYGIARGIENADIQN